MVDWNCCFHFISNYAIFMECPCLLNFTSQLLMTECWSESRHWHCKKACFIVCTEHLHHHSLLLDRFFLIFEISKLFTVAAPPRPSSDYLTCPTTFTFRLLQTDLCTTATDCPDPPEVSLKYDPPILCSVAIVVSWLFVDLPLQECPLSSQVSGA